MNKFKELFKNKKFVVVFGITIIIAAIAFILKDKTPKETPLPEETTDYGNNNDGGGSSFTPQVVPETNTTTPQLEIEDTPAKIDDSAYKQEGSNKIYDLKDLWNSTAKSFGSSKRTKEQQEILDTIHQEAAETSSKYGLGEGGVEGNYTGLLKDTRSYNAITGKSTKNELESNTTTAIVVSRLSAQAEINELKKQYGLAKTKEEKDKIHLQAEKIGIRAGLGVGGTDGSGRKTVDSKGNLKG